MPAGKSGLKISDCLYKTGHVVRLKSGGPALTIEQVWIENLDEVESFRVDVNWFYQGERRDATFWALQLERVPEE